MPAPNPSSIEPPSLVLVVSAASYRAGAFVRAARDSGCRTVLVTDAPQVLASAAGVHQVAVDLGRPGDGMRRVVAALGPRAPDGVLAADEAGLALAAEVAAHFGCRHATPAAVAAAGDKVRQRVAWREAGLAQPAFQVVAADAGVEHLAPGEFPCVVKPASLSASLGVIRVDAPCHLAAVVDRVRGIAARHCRPAMALLVERYVDGPEIALDGLVREGRLDVLAVFDKPDPMPGPYFPETLLVHPSRHATAVLEAVRATAAEAVRAIGLDEGPVHIEMRIEAGVPHLIELAARSVGGRCARAIEFEHGRTLEALLVEHALGRGDRPARAAGAGGVLMVPIPCAGRFVDLDGREAAAATPGVVAVDLTMTRGEWVEPPPDGARYLGFVFARGAGAAAVEAALRRAWAKLTVRIDRGDRARRPGYFLLGRW